MDAAEAAVFIRVVPWNASYRVAVQFLRSVAVRLSRGRCINKRLIERAPRRRGKSARSRCDAACVMMRLLLIRGAYGFGRDSGLPRVPTRILEISPAIRAALRWEIFHG